MKKSPPCTTLILALSFLMFGAAETPPMQSILNHTGAYCLELTRASFAFTCKEKVRWKSDADGKHMYVYAYHLTKEIDSIREKRLIHKKDGKAATRQDASLNQLFSAPYYSFAAALAPVYYLGWEYHRLFRYELTGKRRLLGRHAWEITVFRRPDSPVPAPLRVRREGKRISLEPEGKECPVVTAWVDREDFSVLGFRVFPAGMAGYNELVTAAFRKGLTIKMENLHLCGLLREGIRFPTKTEVTLIYSPLGSAGVPAAREFVHLPGGSSGLGAPAGGRSRGPRHRDSAIFTYTDYSFSELDQ